MPKICYSCQDQSQNDLIPISFKDCKAKNQEDCIIYICKQCFTKNKEIRHDPEAKKRICYLCTELIPKNNIKKLMKGCKAGHSCWLCFQCSNVFDNIENSPKCYICYPCNPKSKECYICRDPDAVCEMVLHRCQKKPEHRVFFCVECLADIPEIIEKNLGCRYCANRSTTNISMLYPTENWRGYSSLPYLTVSDNTTHENIFEIDNDICLTCNPITFASRLMEPSSVNMAKVDNFAAGGASCPVRDFFVVSGGYTSSSEGSLFSSSVTLVYSYIKDGKTKNYFFPMKIKKNQLQESRHFHNMTFVEGLDTLVAFGGNNLKNGANQIGYLDSIEICKIESESLVALSKVQVDENTSPLKWEIAGFKMQKARSVFVSTVYQNKIFVFGGFGGIGLLEPSGEVIDLENGKSTLLEFSMPEGTTFPAAATLLQVREGVVWILGGKDSEGLSQKVLEVDLENLKVTLVKHRLNTKRAGLTGLTVQVKDKKIFTVFAGDRREHDNTNISFEVLILDSEGNSEGWKQTEIKEILQYGFKSEKIRTTPKIASFSSTDTFKFVAQNFDTYLFQLYLDL